MSNKAKDVMSRGITTVHTTTTVQELIRLLKDRGFTGLPVVDSAGRAVGMVSQNDVLQALAHYQSGEEFLQEFQPERRNGIALLAIALEKGRAIALGNLLKQPVEEVMTEGVTSCHPDTDLIEVCRLMTTQGIHRVVVVDDQTQVVGIVSASDLVRRLGEMLA